MDCILHTAQKKFSFYPAVISNEHVLSFRQLDQLVSSTAQKLNIKPGVRVGICSPVSIEYIILLFALWRKKAVVCLLNTHLPKQAVKQHLKTARCRVILDPKKIASLQSDAARPNFRISPDAPATVIFTSGSSGSPKAAVHSYANHYFSALGSNQNIPINPGDRWLLSLPLYHVSGLSILFRTFLGGGAVVIPSQKNSIPPGITHVSLVPTQLSRLLKEKRLINSLKAILVGGASIPVKLIKNSLPIFTTYGLTEMSSQVVTNKKVLAYRQLKISKQGEVLVKGKTLFKGYTQKGKIVAAVDQQGWFHTGDLGKIEKGSLKIIGRKDNMFISGGENIHPEEIERHLDSIPGVERVAVVPVFHPEFGQRPVLFLKINTKVSAQRIKQVLQKEIPRYMVPDRFYHWPSKDTSFKVNRRLLTDLLQRKKAVILS